MALFWHIRLASVDPSKTMRTGRITLAELMIIASFPVNLFRIGTPASRWRYSIRSQEALATRDFLLGIRIGDDKFLIEWSLSECWAVR